MKATPRTWLIAIVGASFAARTAAAWVRPAPALFPDEYIYSALSRSLADTGRPEIRGGAAHFPALLEPILTAPAWLIGDVETAYRVAQGIGTLAMSLAAIPVYLLARRLGLSGPIGLALAALAVLVPDVVYSSFVTAEAFAYPLVLGALYAAVATLVRPTLRHQLCFVLLTGLALLARVQFAVLPVVFVLAVVALGLRERRLRAALREQLVPVGIFVLPLAAVLAVGAGRALGYYHGTLGLRPEPLAFIRWAGSDAMGLAYACGWIIVPGALLGVWFAIARPRSRDELAFGVTGALFALALLMQTSLVQSYPGAVHGTASGINGIQERYFFYVVPLAGLAFALYARRGWPAKLYHLSLAALLLIVSVRVPLSGFASTTTVSGSPILYGVYWLTNKTGDSGSASLAIAVAAAVLLVLTVAGSRSPRVGTPLTLAVALAATATASAGAVAYTVDTTASAKRVFLPADPSFVDSSGLRHVALLETAGSMPAAAFHVLFWNRALDRALLLPHAAPFDRFAAKRVRVGGDGSLFVDGRVVAAPLLVDDYASTVRLRDARPVATSPVSTLWAPHGLPRLSMYAIGRWNDGWLAKHGEIDLWPQSSGGNVAGWLVMRVRLPQDGKRLVLRFAGTPATHRIPVAPGERRTIRLPVCTAGPARITFRSSVGAFVGLRLVSLRASAPVFAADDSACPTIVTPLAGPQL